MKKILLYTLILLMFVLSTGELSAVQIAGVDFRDTESAGEEDLEFRGAGILEWLIFDASPPPGVRGGGASTRWGR